jgi:hypothetical protein
MRCRPTPRPPVFLVTRKRAHYLLVVKANQPTLPDRCARLPWHRVPVGDRTRDRGHGRVELRSLKASASATSGSRTPPRSSRSPANGATRTPPSGRRWPRMRSPACRSSRPAPPAWPTCCTGTGPSKRCTTSAMSLLPRRPARSAPAPPRRHEEPLLEKVYWLGHPTDGRLADLRTVKSVDGSSSLQLPLLFLKASLRAAALGSTSARAGAVPLSP